MRVPHQVTSPIAWPCQLGSMPGPGTTCYLKPRMALADAAIGALAGGCGVY